MNHAAVLLGDTRCFDRVVFGCVVEVSFLIIPLEHVSPRILRTHLEIERDSDEGLVFGDIIRVRAESYGSASSSGEDPGQKLATRATGRSGHWHILFVRLSRADLLAANGRMCCVG